MEWALSNMSRIWSDTAEDHELFREWWFLVGHHNFFDYIKSKEIESGNRDNN